ncbi:MAG: NAD(P)H-binding protein [Sulfitobacter sp.]
MAKVIVLGAKGRFGKGAVSAFAAAGWQVTAFARHWDNPTTGPVKTAEGNAMDPATLVAACQGFDVIVNALNPLYENWARDLMPMTQAVITAARDSGATVIIPGNVYNYGADGPDVWSETTPWRPTTRKGRLRVQMETAYRTAGVRTIVLRGGDFITGGETTNWFEAHIAKGSRKGRTMYPGPKDRKHAWAYLPDMTRAAVLLAEQRDRFAAFEEFGFGGYTLTGAELVEEIAQATGQAQKLSGLPWPLLRFLGLFSAGMRELIEMRYLWNVPHRMDGSKLARTLPGFRQTPLAQALKQALAVP